MSLWTPDGEVPIERGGPSDVADPKEQIPGFPNLDDLSPEDRERAEQMVSEMAEVQRQIVAAPASQILANHVIGIYELAAIHLAQEKPKFDEARLAIDALAAVLGAVGDRLESVAPGLGSALTQVQMAYVQRKEGEEPSSD